MNRCLFVGRLVRDPEVKMTKNEKCVCSFTLACKDRNETDFVDCEVWGKQAENLSIYKRKGEWVSVEGRQKTDSYESNGQKRRKTYILADNVEYIGSNKAEPEEDAPKDFWL